MWTDGNLIPTMLVIYVTLMGDFLRFDVALWSENLLKCREILLLLMYREIRTTNKQSC
jgi:hypothetical protein